MNNQRYLILWIILTIFAAILACNLPGRTTDVETSIAATQTALARAVQNLQDQQQVQDAPVEVPQASDMATLEPEPTQTPSPTVEPTIEHLTQPGEPERVRTWVTDISSEPFAPENRTIGDNLNINLLERPFTADVMVYQPYLDITKTELGEGGEWLYVIVILEEEPPEAVEATYTIEIDLDRDGSGDWLISALVPPTDQWTTDGVRVWRDANRDVGGQKPMIAEAPLAGLDGYEELVFEDGRGDDPDAAWVRRAPSIPNQVHLAFKHTLIGSASTFLWGCWSDEGVKEQGWFDYNDHFTLEQAGSPAINNDHYPLKELFSMDNTCRWTYGFEPTTAYPGLCPLPTPTPTPTRTPRPTLCPPPAAGCPKFIFGSTSVQYIWNTDSCECVAP